jgi:hypothetical protein
MAQNNIETLNEQLQSWLNIPGAVIEVCTDYHRYEARKVSGWAIIAKTTGEKDHRDKEFRNAASTEEAGTEACFFEEYHKGPYFRITKGDEVVLNTYSSLVKRVSINITFS